MNNRETRIAPVSAFAYAVTKNYSLTMQHVNRVADLADRLNISQGEVVRRAIDLLFSEYEADPKAHTQPISNPT